MILSLICLLLEALMFNWTYWLASTDISLGPYIYFAVSVLDFAPHHELCSSPATSSVLAVCLLPPLGSLEIMI